MKGLTFLFVVESPQLKRMVLHICGLGPISLFKNKLFVHEHLALLQKIMKVDVLPTIGECVTMTTKFESKMSRLSYDTFALVINFINQDWVDSLPHNCWTI